LGKCANAGVCSYVAEESTNVVDIETSTWTTVATSSLDMSPPEVMRTAALHDDYIDKIEAAIVTTGNKHQHGNGVC